MKKAIQGQEGTTIYSNQDSVGILFRYLPINSDGTIIADLNAMRPQEKAIWAKQALEAIQDDNEDE